MIPSSGGVLYAFGQPVPGTLLDIEFRWLVLNEEGEEDGEAVIYQRRILQCRRTTWEGPTHAHDHPAGRRVTGEWSTINEVMAVPIQAASPTRKKN